MTTTSTLSLALLTILTVGSTAHAANPVLSYASATRIPTPDEAKAIAVDAHGNTYVLCNIERTAPTISSFGDQDILLFKVDPSGEKLLFAVVIGGPESDRGNALAVDANGFAYIAGATNDGQTFPITPDAFATAMAEPNPFDGFVMKINTNAAVEESLVYSTYFNVTSVNGIAADAAGAIYITGETTLGMPVTAGAFQAGSPGSPYHPDAFVAKFDLSRPGQDGLIYATYLGGTTPSIGFRDAEKGNAIAVDREGNAIVVGETMATDFPVSNAHQGTYAGFTADGFIAKLNRTGTGLIYSSYLGGERWDVAKAVAVDAKGNAYVTGSTTSLQFPVTTGASQPEWNAGTCGTITEFLPCADAFVAKFEPDGRLAYSTYLGGHSHDYGNAITADDEGNTLIAGYALSANFPLLNPIAEGASGANDSFVTALDPQGRPLFSTYLGGTDRDEATGVAFWNGQILIVGVTRSAEFRPAGADLSGLPDGFLARITMP